MEPLNNSTSAYEKAKEENGSEGFSLANNLPERQVDNGLQAANVYAYSYDYWTGHAQPVKIDIPLKGDNETGDEVKQKTPQKMLPSRYAELSGIIKNLHKDQISDVAKVQHVQDLVCAIYSPACAYDEQALEDTECNSVEEFTRKILEKLYVGMISTADLKKQIAEAETDEQAAKIWSDYTKERNITGWGRARSRRDALEAVDNFAKSHDLAKFSVSLITANEQEFSKAVRMSVLSPDKQKEYAQLLFNEDRESAPRIIAAAYSMQAYSDNCAAGAFLYAVLNNTGTAITDFYDFFSDITEDKYAEDLAKIVHQHQGDKNGNYGRTKELTLTNSELMQVCEEFNKTLDEEIQETRKREFETVSRRGALRTGLSHKTQKKIAELEAMKLMTPEQVREFYEKGYDIESKHFAAQQVKVLNKDKYRKEDALINFADRSGALLGYMLPMIAVHAGLEAATGGAATPYLYALDAALWFPSLYQEAYGMHDENMDTTTRMGARRSQALFAASINSVTQALEVGVFVKGVGGVFRGITGRAAGRASIDFSKRGAFTFLKDSVSAETHLFRAKYYDSFVNKISYGLARNGLRWGLDMTVEGLQEGSEELVKALAREAFDAHIKDFEGKDAVDRDAVVQSFWENFRAAAIDGLPAMILLRGVPAMAHRVRGRTVGDIGIFGVAGASAADLSFMSAAQQTNHILFTDLTKTQERRDFIIDYGNTVSKAKRIELQKSSTYKNMSQKEKDMLETYAVCMQWLNVQTRRALNSKRPVRGMSEELMQSIKDYGRERDKAVRAAKKLFKGKELSDKQINKVVARRLAFKAQQRRVEFAETLAKEQQRVSANKAQKAKQAANKAAEDINLYTQKLNKAKKQQAQNKKKIDYFKDLVQQTKELIEDHKKVMANEDEDEKAKKDSQNKIEGLNKKLKAYEGALDTFGTKDMNFAAEIAGLEEKIKKLNEQAKSAKSEQIWHEGDEEYVKRFAKNCRNAARMFDEHLEGEESSGKKKRRSINDIANDNADEKEAAKEEARAKRNMVYRAIKPLLKKIVKQYGILNRAKAEYQKVQDQIKNAEKREGYKTSWLEYRLNCIKKLALSVMTDEEKLNEAKENQRANRIDIGYIKDEIERTKDAIEKHKNVLAGKSATAEEKEDLRSKIKKLNEQLKAKEKEIKALTANGKAEKNRTEIRRARDMAWQIEDAIDEHKKALTAYDVAEENKKDSQNKIKELNKQLESDEKRLKALEAKDAAITAEIAKLQEKIKKFPTTEKDKKFREKRIKEIDEIKALYREFNNLKYNDSSIYYKIESLRRVNSAIEGKIQKLIYEEEEVPRFQKEVGRAPSEEELNDLWERAGLKILLRTSKTLGSLSAIEEAYKEYRKIVHKLRKTIDKQMGANNTNKRILKAYFNAIERLDEELADLRDMRIGRHENPDGTVRVTTMKDRIERVALARAQLNKAKEAVLTVKAGAKYVAAADALAQTVSTYARLIEEAELIGRITENEKEIKQLKDQKKASEQAIKNFMKRKIDRVDKDGNKVLDKNGEVQKVSETNYIVRMYDLNEAVRKIQAAQFEIAKTFNEIDELRKAQFPEETEDEKSSADLVDGNKTITRNEWLKLVLKESFADLVGGSNTTAREWLKPFLKESFADLVDGSNTTTREWLKPFLKEEKVIYDQATERREIPFPWFMPASGATQSANFSYTPVEGEVLVDDIVAEMKQQEDIVKRLVEGPWTEGLSGIIANGAAKYGIDISTEEGMTAVKEAIVSSEKLLGPHAPEIMRKAKNISEKSKLYSNIYNGLVDYAFASLIKGGIRDVEPVERDSILGGISEALDIIWDEENGRDREYFFVWNEIAEKDGEWPLEKRYIREIDVENDYVEQALQAILGIGEPVKKEIYSAEDIAQGETGGYLPNSGRARTVEAEDEESLKQQAAEGYEESTPTEEAESVTDEEETEEGLIDDKSAAAETVEEDKDEVSDMQGGGYALGRYLASLSMIFSARSRATTMIAAWEKKHAGEEVTSVEASLAKWFENFKVVGFFGALTHEYPRYAKEFATHEREGLEPTLKLIKDGKSIPLDPFFRAMQQSWQIEKPTAETARIQAGDMWTISRLLRSFLPGIGVRSVTLDEMSDLIGRDATNVWGYYDADTHEIVIRENAPISTAVHEMWHAVYRGSAKFLPELHQRMREYIRTAPPEIVAKVKEYYKDRGLTEEQVLDEIGAMMFALEFSGRLSDFIKQTNNPKQVRSWWTKLKQMFTRLWHAILGKQFGESFVNMNQFKGVSGKEAMSRLVDSFLAEQKLRYDNAQATFWDAAEMLNSVKMGRRFDEHTEAREDRIMPEFQGDSITALFGRILRKLVFGEQFDATDPHQESIMQIIKEQESGLLESFVAGKVHKEGRRGKRIPQDRVLGDEVLRNLGVAILEDRIDVRGYAKDVLNAFEKVYEHRLVGTPEKAFDDAKRAVLFRYNRILPYIAEQYANTIKEHLPEFEKAKDNQHLLNAANKIENAIHEDMDPRIAKKFRELINDWMDPKKTFAGKRANPYRTRGIGIYEKFMSELRKAMKASDKAHEIEESSSSTDKASAWSDYYAQYDKYAAVANTTDPKIRTNLTDDVLAQDTLLAKAWELFKDKPFSTFTTKDLVDLYAQLRVVSDVGHIALKEERQKREQMIKEAAPIIDAAGEQASVHKSNKRTSKFRQFFRSGYSIEELLDTAVDYAKKGAREAAHAWNRKLSLELNKAYIRETRFTYNAYTRMFRSAVKYMKPLDWKGPFAGYTITEETIDKIGSDEIWEDKKARFYVASLIAVTLNETRKDSSMFSLKGDKLTMGQLLAQYMMLTQKEIEIFCQGQDMAKKKHDAKKAEVELKVSDKRKKDPNYQITIEEAEALEDFEEKDLYKQWKKKAALRDYLGNDLVKFGEEVSDIFQSFNTAIDQESLRSVGWAMSYKAPGYFPIVRDMPDYMTNKVPTGILTLVPTTLTPRTISDKPIDETAEFMAIFSRHVFDIAHFVSYGDVKPLIREMVQGKEMEQFRRDIAASCGEEHLKQLMQHLTQVYNGYMPEGDAYMENGEIWRNLRTFSRFSAMFFSLPAGAVQMVGSMLAPSTTIGWKEMGKSYIYALTHREEFAHAMHMLLHSDAWKARNKDPNMATLAILSQSSTHGLLRNANPKMRLLMHQLMNLGMAPTSYGDRVPSLVNGAAYIAMRIPQLRQGAWLKDENGNEETPEAREKRIEKQAVLEASKMIDETQQARDPQSKDVYSRSPNSFTRLFIQFRTSPIQYAMKEIRAIERMVAEKSFESVRDWVCIGGHNHFVAPIMAMLGRALPALIAYAIFGGDDPDKEELKKILNIRGSQIIAGSAESIPIAGWGLSLLSDAAITIAGGKAPNYFSSKSLIDIPSADIVTRLTYSTVRVGTSIRNTDPDALKKSLDMAGRNFGAYRTLSSLAELFPGSDANSK